jgi:hypothetical protein
MRASGMRASAPRELLHDGRTRFYLDIYCTRHVLNGVFSRLAEELLRETERPIPDAGRRCTELLEGWRSLFSSGAGEFGRLQAIGLLGELWVLHRLALIDVASLDTWTGPLGGVHDFRNGDSAIEVKTSVRTHGRFHSISSVEQLAPPSNGKLGFFSLRLESVPSGTVSIAGLLKKIRATGVLSSALSMRLDEINFVEGNQPEFEDERYEMREARFFEVGADFPRIIPAIFPHSRLPAGVLSISYDIDLSGELPRPMDDLLAERWLTSFTCRH